MNPHVNLNGVCMIKGFESLKIETLRLDFDINEVFEVRTKRFVVLDRKISKP